MKKTFYYRNKYELQKGFRIMKITVFLCLISVIQVFAVPSLGQVKLNLRMKNTTIEEVLQKMEESTEFRFFYRSKDLNGKELIDIEFEQKTVNEILDNVLPPLQLNYEVFDNYIAIRTVDDINSSRKTVLQQKSVSGKVTDSSGLPLPGVTVVVKGTIQGTITNPDGEYSLSNVPDNTILQFSFVGMKTVEIPVNGKTNIDIVMTTETLDVEEVIVTGYSVERKKDIIGSISIVDTKEMLSTPSGNLTSQLSGRVAGVTVSSDGSVDGSSKVRIRGFGSFSGSDPLYIIDGVPGDVTNLNPNDIESVQVLKDAASASVYGARAANGVIIITTKQGTKGPVKFSIDAYSGVNYVSKNDFPDLLNPQEWGELYFSEMAGAGRSPGDANWTHAQYGSGATPVIPEYILANVNGSRTGGAALEEMRINDPERFYYYTNPDNYDFETHQIVKSGNTDWFDEVYNPSSLTNIQISASGGSEGGTYSIGLNYFDQTSTYSKYEYFRRYTLRANTNFNVSKFFRIGENLQISYNKGRDLSSINIPGAAWTMPAILPVYDIMGNPASSKAPMICSTNDSGLGNNPITEAWRNRFDGYYTYGIFGNFFAEFEPISDFILRTSFGIDYDTRTSKDLTQVTYEHAEDKEAPNKLTWSWNNKFAWTWTNTLTYSKALGLHKMKVLVGTEAIDRRIETTSASRTDLELDDEPSYLVIDAGTGTQTNSGTFSANSLFSVFGRLDYTYADKYIFNATLRRDGSSKFGENNRYGYFPAVAMGWRITGEDFMSNFEWLTDLKLRASYGIIGNQTGLANENQFSTYVQTEEGTYPIDGTTPTNSYIKSRVGNPDARWEKSKTTNLGADVSLFSGKLILNADFFIKKTSDLLVTYQAPKTEAKITQPMKNVGTIKNTGIDFVLTKRGKIIGELEYEISANFSAYKNEVLKVLDNPDAVLYGGENRLGYNTITRKGDPISSFYGYKIEGFFNTQEKVDAYIATINNTWLPPAVGRWKIKDVNGDNIINDNDRTIIGSPHPDFQIGLNMSLAYKNFDFNMFVFWNQGGDLFNGSRYNVDFNVYQFNRSARMLYDSWTPENTDALLPKHDLNDTYSFKYTTDYFVEDATYVRLKTMQLGYTLPRNLLNTIRIEKLRVFCQAQNLITWKKEFTGLDPGISISGEDLGMGVVNSYAPTPKQVLFGFTVSF